MSSRRRLGYETGPTKIGARVPSMTRPAQARRSSSSASSLVVVDRHAGRLLELDANGQLTGVGARRGWEPGLLLYPAGAARLPDGGVVVADEGNGRTQFFRRARSSGS